MTDAYIFDAVRTPRGKGKKDGSLHEVKAIDLLKNLFDALQQRNALDTSQVEDVILGCVTAMGEQGADIAKTAALYAGWDQIVAGVTLNRFCGSGLEACNLAAMKIQSGQEDLVVAGGVEAMSRVPMMSDGGDWFLNPNVNHSLSFIPQGVSADLIASMQNYSREQVDQFAVESHRKAALAQQQGRFDKSIVAIKDINGLTLLDHDETVRADSSVEGLAALKPSFAAMAKMGFDATALRVYPQLENLHHVHHAGNSSGIVDGAALMLIGSLQKGQQLGLKPRAKFRSVAVTSTEPTIMLLGPAPASRKALKKANLNLADIDLFEVNEAFAAVVMKFRDELDVDPSRINVNGGAIALGHPLGATGCMILGTLLDELERQDKTLGLTTLCIGGGMGIATIIERV